MNCQIQNYEGAVIKESVLWFKYLQLVGMKAVELDDLKQVAWMEVIKAINDFDAKKHPNINTHVYSRLRYALRNYAFPGSLHEGPKGEGVRGWTRTSFITFENDEEENYGFLGDPAEERQARGLEPQANHGASDFPSLDILTPLNRQILIWKYVDGYDNAEIADLIGCKRPSAVTNRIRRSLDAIKEHYNEEDLAF